MSEEGGYKQEPGQPMTTAGRLFKLRYALHSFGDVNLGREVPLGQLVAGVFGFLLAFLPTWFLVGGIPSFVAGGLCAAGLVALFTRIEEGGRTPFVEACRAVSFYRSPRYYRGARPLKGVDEARMREVFAREKAREKATPTAREVLVSGAAEVLKSVTERRKQ